MFLPKRARSICQHFSSSLTQAPAKHPSTSSDTLATCWFSLSSLTETFNMESSPWLQIAHVYGQNVKRGIFSRNLFKTNCLHRTTPSDIVGGLASLCADNSSGADISAHNHVERTPMERKRWREKMAGSNLPGPVNSELLHPGLQGGPLHSELRRGSSWPAEHPI